MAVTASHSTRERWHVALPTGNPETAMNDRTKNGTATNALVAKRFEIGVRRGLRNTRILA